MYTIVGMKINKITKKSNHPFRSERKALFSENERKYLNGNRKMSYDDQLDFERLLRKRFDALLEDLRLIHDDSQKKLLRWKQKNSFNYKNNPEHWVTGISLIDILFHNSSQILYVDEIKQSTKGKGKNKKNYFWLKLRKNPEKINYKTITKAEKPKHLFRSIPNYDEDWFKTYGIPILQAYEIKREILPTKPEDKISFQEIEKRLSGKSHAKTNIKHYTNKEFSEELPEDYKRKIKIEKLITRKLKKLREDAKENFGASLKIPKIDYFY